MGKWAKVLRETDIKQATSVMVREDGSMCCLGVLESVVLGIGFHKGDFVDTLVDTFGCVGVPGNTVTKMTNLNRIVTTKEFNKINSILKKNGYVHYEDIMFLPYGTYKERYFVLSQLNDSGVKFRTIARILEELGWDDANEWSLDAIDSRIR